MAISFLNSKERDSFQKLPLKMDAEDIQQYFFITREDKIFLQNFNGNLTKTAIVLQIGIVRFFGYLPETWYQQIDINLLNFVLEGLRINQGLITDVTDYGNRQATRSTHLQQVLKYLLFAFFNLVNKKLISRLRDLKGQRLCKIKSSMTPEYNDLEYPPLKFTGTVNIDYLKKNAHELQRVSASLQTGTVTASLLMNKLQAYPRQNNLMYVLQAYGQLEKTVFICNYLLIPPMRKKINRQLNKGEQLHNLRSYLWFGSDGFIRKQQEAEQQITAFSLTLLTNIVMAWNTVYIQQMLGDTQSKNSKKRVMRSMKKTLTISHPLPLNISIV